MTIHGCSSSHAQAFPILQLTVREIRIDRKPAATREDESD
jgi:hypothetical protein